ncbi:predicted protein [Histoplasma capsulatum G186AR]|uniref:Uncharacterized protein n=1 Tax=Ajellomyces capsulatus (strain G186AR / H82 / ATCC MYA-2454 / RMSCC 2432) TaxID=447093 RepID=C0NY18_AJECG|nr:uncharacterized protein HCBG_07812 [Histoplasma capsulatum G186AR]EEH03686.1 predicted protein [Histoplasma capsulatum G186AR]
MRCQISFETDTTLCHGHGGGMQHKLALLGQGHRPLLFLVATLSGPDSTRMLYACLGCVEIHLRAPWYWMQAGDLSHKIIRSHHNSYVDSPGWSFGLPWKLRRSFQAIF